VTAAILIGLGVLAVAPPANGTSAALPVPTAPPAAVIREMENIILVGDFSEGLDGTVPRSWELDDKKEPISISLSSEGVDWAVEMASSNSAFGIYRELDFNLKHHPYLNWEWKVEELPRGGNFLDPETDDQAGQVYISFGSLSFLNKPFVKAVGYYWSSTAPVGTSGPCPTWGKSRVIVLKSGPEKLGEWVREKRNVYQDYLDLFDGEKPERVSALRLYTNSQHSGSGTRVSFRNIYFSKE